MISIIHLRPPTPPPSPTPIHGRRALREQYLSNISEKPVVQLSPHFPVYKAGVEEEDSHSFVINERIHKQLNYEGYGKLKKLQISRPPPLL